MLADQLSPASGLSLADTWSRRLTGLQHQFGPLAKLGLYRGGSVLAQLAVQLVVATMAGAAGLGILQVVTSWTCIAGEVLAQGLPVQAMRSVSVDFTTNRQSRARRTIGIAQRRIVLVWAALLPLACGLLYLFSWQGSWSASGTYTWLMLAAFIVAPLFSLLRLYAESLKAADAPVPAVVVESLSSPAVVLLLCAGTWLTARPLTAMTLVLGFGLSQLIAVILLRSRLNRRLKDSTVVPGQAQSQPAKSATVSGDLAYLWACGILSIAFLQLPFLVMPLFATPDEIGVFAVAHKLLNIITTLLLLLAALFGPRFARCAAQNDRAGLTTLLLRSQAISTIIFLPAALVLLVFADRLATLFGVGAAEMQGYLLILAAGQLFNAATGLSGVLLNMAGAARQETACLAVSLLLALLACAWIGPLYGSIGVALVFSTSIAIKNLVSWLLVRRLLQRTGR